MTRIGGIANRKPINTAELMPTPEINQVTALKKDCSVCYMSEAA